MPKSANFTRINRYKQVSIVRVSLLHCSQGPSDMFELHDLHSDSARSRAVLGTSFGGLYISGDESTSVFTIWQLGV